MDGVLLELKGFHHPRFIWDLGELWPGSSRLGLEDSHTVNLRRRCRACTRYLSIRCYRLLHYLKLGQHKQSLASSTTHTAAQPTVQPS